MNLYVNAEVSLYELVKALEKLEDDALIMLFEEVCSSKGDSSFQEKVIAALTDQLKIHQDFLNSI